MLSKEPELLASMLLRENMRGKIIIPMSNLTLYRKSFSYRGICYWNTLPERLRNISRIGLFKIELKKWIFSEVSKF